MRPYKAHWIKNPGRRLHPARQKAIPLSRCARVRFAPPFVPKGEDKRGTPYFDHPLRDEGGRQARRTLLRSPSSERRGKTSTAHPTSITLFGTKGEDKHGASYFDHPLRNEGEDKDGAPYFDHPLRNEGGRQARRTLLRSPSSERRGETSTAHRTSITLFGTKGEDKHGAPYFDHPLRNEGEDKGGSPYFDHPLRDEGGRREAPGGCHCASGQNDTVGPQAIVTNSSAEVGWIATVRRKSA